MLTTEELNIAANIIAYGQGFHDPLPVDYNALVIVWDDPVIIAIPPEAEFEAVWRQYLLEQSTIDLFQQTILEMQLTNSIEIDMEVELADFNAMIDQIKAQILTDGEKAQLVYDTKTKTVVLIQRHHQEILSVLDDSTLDSLDVEAGTIDGVTKSWATL